MKKQNNPKKPNTKNTLLRLTVVLLSVLLTLAVLSLVLLASWFGNVNDDRNKSVERSFSAGKASIGFACGALDRQMAVELLGGEVNKRSYVTPSELYGRVPVWATDDIHTGLTESCSYDLESSSQIYVSLAVTSFVDDAMAEKYFDKIRQSRPETLPQEFNSARLDYSNDGFRMLKNNRVYLVAASNGNVSENENFSRDLFYRLLPKFQ